MARRRVVFGIGLRAGARVVSGSLRALVSVHRVSALHRALVLAPLVSASLLALALARGVSALSPALASEETASRAR